MLIEFLTNYECDLNETQQATEIILDAVNVTHTLQIITNVYIIMCEHSQQNFNKKHAVPSRCEIQKRKNGTALCKKSLEQQ